MMFKKLSLGFCLIASVSAQDTVSQTNFSPYALIQPLLVLAVVEPLPPPEKEIVIYHLDKQKPPKSEKRYTKSPKNKGRCGKTSRYSGR